MLDWTKVAGLFPICSAPIPVWNGAYRLELALTDVIQKSDEFPLAENKQKSKAWKLHPAGRIPLSPRRPGWMPWSRWGGTPPQERKSRCPSPWGQMALSYPARGSRSPETRLRSKWQIITQWSERGEPRSAMARVPLCPREQRPQGGSARWAPWRDPGAVCVDSLTPTHRNIRVIGISEI